MAKREGLLHQTAQRPAYTPHAKEGMWSSPPSCTGLLSEASEVHSGWKSLCKLWVVANACNLSTQESERGWPRPGVSLREGNQGLGWVWERETKAWGESERGWPRSGVSLREGDQGLGWAWERETKAWGESERGRPRPGVRLREDDQGLRLVIHKPKCRPRERAQQLRELAGFVVAQSSVPNPPPHPHSSGFQPVTPVMGNWMPYFGLHKYQAHR
jgi:hypothetical protein